MAKVIGSVDQSVVNTWNKTQAKRKEKYHAAKQKAHYVPEVSQYPVC